MSIVPILKNNLTIWSHCYHSIICERHVWSIAINDDTSKTRLGDLLDFWATFQSIWQQLFCPNLPQSKEFFVKVSKSLIFLLKSFLGNFYRHLAIFFWSHWMVQQNSFASKDISRRQKNEVPIIKRRRRWRSYKRSWFPIQNVAQTSLLNKWRYCQETIGSVEGALVYWGERWSSG